MAEVLIIVTLEIVSEGAIVAKVCAVVVTYNRKKLLVECLNALLNQTYGVERIIVIDNHSTDGTNTELLSRGLLGPKSRDKSKDFELYSSNLIDYYFMEQNSGGAGGFSFGIERATLQEFDWVWVMDDDAEPASDALEKMLHVENASSYSFLAPRVIHALIPGHTEYYHHKTKIDLLLIKEENLRDKNLNTQEIKLEANGFVGPLLNMKSIRKVGLPDKSFFIWWDDTDYTYRLFKECGPGLLVASAIMRHKDRVVSEDVFDWKTYYGIRNRTRFFRKHVSVFGFAILAGKILRQYIRYFGVMDQDKLHDATWREFFRKV